MLAEWAQYRDASRSAFRRLVLSFIAIVLAAGLGLPPLNEARVAARQQVELASKDFAAADASLQSLLKEQEEARPKLDNEALRTSLRRRSRQFVGQLVYVINSAPAGMALEQVSADVVGGEQTIKVKADAEQDSVLRTFIATAGEGPNTLSAVIASSRESSQLNENGVAFQFVKKVGVGP